MTHIYTRTFNYNNKFTVALFPQNILISLKPELKGLRSNKNIFIFLRSSLSALNLYNRASVKLHTYLVAFFCKIL